MRRALLTILLAAATIVTFAAHESTQRLTAGTLSTCDLQTSSAEQRSCSWPATLDITSNAFISWRIDQWVSAGAELLSTLCARTISPLAILAAILASGIFILAGSARNLRLRPPLAAPSSAADSRAAFADSLIDLTIAYSATLLLGRIAPGNVILFGFVAWLPWLAAIILFSVERRCPAPTAILLVLFCSYRTSRSANQLAPLVVAIAALLVAAVRSAAHPRTKPRPEHPSDGNGLLLPWVFFALLIAHLPLWQAPVPDLPDYPRALGVRIVPDDGIAGDVSPLVGWSAPLRIIDRQAVRDRARAWALPLICAAAAILLLKLLPRRGSAGTDCGSAAAVGYVNLLLGFLVLLDSIPREAVAQISPLGSIARMIPGWFEIPLALPLSIALICGVALQLAVLPRKIRLLAALVWLTPETYLVNVVNESGPAAASSANKLELAALLTRDLQPERRNLISPSFATAAYYGQYFDSFRAFDRRDRPGPRDPAITDPIATPVANLRPDLRPIELSAGTEPQHLARLFDGRRETRWAYRGRGQHGDEWLALRFAAPQKLAAIKLDLGRFNTDFPRGIRLVAAVACQPGETLAPASPARSQSSIAFETRSWQGPVRFTPRHFPYFAAQSEVEIPFPEGSEIQCLRIEQIGNDPLFDWSIAEIELLR